MIPEHTKPAQGGFGPPKCRNPIPNTYGHSRVWYRFTIGLKQFWTSLVDFACVSIYQWCRDRSAPVLPFLYGYFTALVRGAQPTNNFGMNWSLKMLDKTYYF